MENKGEGGMARQGEREREGWRIEKGSFVYIQSACSEMGALVQQL